MSHLLSPVFGPGFFESEAVAVGLGAGALAAIVAATVGVLTVIRGQTFAGHAFGDIGTTGGSGAYLVGVGPLWGFIVGSLLGAGAMELVGVQRPRGRDLATGIVLGATIGLAALFLYLGMSVQSTTGATVSILFGSVFAISSSTIPVILVLGFVVLGGVTLLYRPLLLSSVSPDIAAAQGLPTRLIGALYLVAVGLAVALAAVTIGTILSTALLIGPAASALRLARSPLRAIVLAACLGTASMWAGIVLAYDSYSWTSGHAAWPASFFVVSIVLATYLLAGLPAAIARRRRGRAGGALRASKAKEVG